MDKIRNADFMCESCQDGFEPHDTENRCIPEPETCHAQEQILVGDSCVNCQDSERFYVDMCVLRCGENQVPNGPDCVCIAGYEIYDVNGECVPMCGDNEEWNGESCVCVDGYERLGSVCVPECGDNAERNSDGVCVCVDGYEIYDANGECVPMCGDNEEWNGESCVCVDGYERLGSVCVPECIDGVQERVNGNCVPTIASCRENGEIRNADFMCESCQDGYKLHDNENRCILDDECPAGERYVNLEYRCVSQPPFNKMRSESLDFLREYDESGGNLHQVGNWTYQPSGWTGDYTLVEFAAQRYSSVDAVAKFEYLVDQGVNVNRIANHSGTAKAIVHYLALTNQPWYSDDEANRLAMLKHVVNNRPDFNVNVYYGHIGITPLHNLAWHSSDGVVPFMEALLQGNANVNQRDASDRTPLYLAVVGGSNSWVTTENQISTMEFLIDNGADCNIADNRGRTPWTRARDNGFTQALWYLKRNCPQPETQAAQNTACEQSASATLNENGELVIGEIEECNDAYVPDITPIELPKLEVLPQE